MITQLIFNNTIYLPETSRDKYRCYAQPLTRILPMISGRTVLEGRGHVHLISYAYDYMGNDLLRELLAVLRSGQPFTVTYLPDDSDDMETSTFLVERLDAPSYAFSKGKRALWHKISFSLREVQPYD